MFEQLLDKAQGELANQGYNNADTPIFRGIGYAILALAVAIKDQGSKAAPTEGEDNGS